MSIPKEAADALALVVTEWFKAARRLHKLTGEVAPGRFERERAQLSYSSERIQNALNALQFRLVTYDGESFSAQLPVEPVNPEDFDSEEGLIVSETLEPTILYADKMIMRGRVVLAKGS